MANQSTFPTTLDGTPTDRAIGDPVPVTDWNQYMDAIDQLETKVGVDSSAVTGSIDYQIKTLPASGIKSRVVQVVNYQTGEVATGSTVLPLDNTIPQSGEGDQYMSLAITPTNATNILMIDVVWAGASSYAGANNITVALFQDTTANALAAIMMPTGGQHVMTHLNFRHYMVAGTINATTFKVRAGGQAAGTTTFNGANGAQFFGGVYVSSITITEIAV